MTIERVIVENYRILRSVDITLNPDLNIFVGDNESGKSTLLEAINLALKCHLNRRPAAYELHPFLFNIEAVAEFIQSYKDGNPKTPPEILIEIYLIDEGEYAELKGTNNSKSLDKPGISLRICFDEDLKAEYEAYFSDLEKVHTLPIEFYQIEWRDFSGQIMNPRKLPVQSALIDPSAISNTYAANKFVLEAIRDFLTKEQNVSLSLSYRGMREKFLSQDGVIEINDALAEKKDIISDKMLSVAMDTTTRASWETGVIPHLDEIPLTLVGKGEQSSIKIKLAVESQEQCQVLLMEEPENHLTYANLNRLVNHLATKAEGRQLILTTHSSFVLNKLGVDHMQMFSGNKAITLNELPETTKNYFMKLAGYDTLRLILAGRAILVEGPSDELVVQKAYFQDDGNLPIEDGIEVISVNSLAFKRFLDISKLLEIRTSVVTDNDGAIERLTNKYVDYAGCDFIDVCFDDDEDYPTLEPQILRVNDREKLNGILSKEFESDDELLEYMSNNKTDVALAILLSEDVIEIPEYIKKAIA